MALKMKDGILKLLQNVRHVPGPKRNLISLGMLDSIGCEYNRQGGMIEVRKNSKIVLTTEKVNDLYVVRDIV